MGFIILKAREYDVKESDSDPDEGSNAIDDGQTDVLADEHDDPVREELLGAIRSLNEDERIRLVALAWLGRGTYGKDEWREAVATARTEQSRRTAEYLLGLPLLGDYLEDGLAMFDEGIVDDADTREGLDSEDEPLDGMQDKPRSAIVRRGRCRRRTQISPLPSKVMNSMPRSDRRRGIPAQCCPRRQRPARWRRSGLDVSQISFANSREQLLCHAGSRFARRIWCAHGAI